MKGIAVQSQSLRLNNLRVDDDMGVLEGSRNELEDTKRQTVFKKMNNFIITSFSVSCSATLNVP